ncbi:hypothetical protein [Hamadaea tsunoensis]|uniref:hypothetical protein n=1 Tax=Hamadaea tsunoensis TaxID=53368 RepID=UPI000429BF4A|nr:hypothetical protein [Hamadaea tsunoensis]
MTENDFFSRHLRELAHHEDPAGPDTRQLLQRGRRARRRRTVIAGTSLAVLAAGALTAVGVAAQPSAPGDRPAITADAADARTQLVAAITASRSTSYRLTIRDNLAPAATGAYDPVTKQGFLHRDYSEGPGYEDQRVVDGALYVGDAGLDGVEHWRLVPGVHDTFQYDASLGDRLSGSADPDALLDELRKDGVTITQIDKKTFGFEFSPALDEYRASDHYSGEVVVDGKGRIAKVEFKRAVRWQKPGYTPPSAQPPAIITAGLTFSDYGTPVQVTAPTLG